MSAYGALERIGEIKARYAPQKTLLVTGRGSYEACGAKAVIDAHFTADETIRFSDFEVNPRMADGQRGLQITEDAGIDLILAVGGGSVMDMAKMIKAFMTAGEDTEAVVRGQKPVQACPIPLVAVPTTAGSGSEATHFAVVYIGKEKYSLASPYMLPDSVILDGKLLKSASPYQKAVNGLDALAQAIEGCWAVGSTGEIRKYGFEAIELLVKHLPAMVKGNQADDLQAVILASNLAGKAINISKTTAPHAFSYAFTSYHDVPHGHAVWLTLPEVFAIHLASSAEKTSDPRGAGHLEAIMQKLLAGLGIERGDDSAAFLRSFMQKLGIESDMRNMGIKTTDQRAFIAAQVNAQRLGNITFT